MEYTKKVFAFLLYSILCVWGILTARVKYELLSYFNNIFLHYLFLYVTIALKTSMSVGTVSLKFSSSPCEINKGRSKVAASV